MDGQDFFPSSSFGGWNDYDWVQQSLDQDRLGKQTNDSPRYSAELPSNQRVNAQAEENDLEDCGKNMKDETTPQKLGELLPFDWDEWMKGEAMKDDVEHNLEENGGNENGLETKEKTIPEDSEELSRLNFDLMGDFDEDKDTGDFLGETKNSLVKKEEWFENDIAVEEENTSDQANSPTEEEPAKGFEDLTVELRKKIFKLAFVEEDQILVQAKSLAGQTRYTFSSIKDGVKDHGPTNVYPKIAGFPVALFATKKSIYNEAIPIFSGKNKWIFYVGDAPENQMGKYFCSFQDLQTQQIYPRSTLRHFTEIKLVEMSRHEDLAEVTDPFRRAAEEAESLGLPFRLQKLYIRKLQWKNSELAAQLAPMLIAIFKAIHNLNPGVSVKNSGVLDIVDLISWDLGADAEQKRKARNRTRKVMGFVEDEFHNAGYV
ncbi:hypothetical protein HII31_09436 [Pseudocercospora fuligena]|uniref:Uncharacterized protein n=1 Tax=Pseudocercospora fuligena TaxID=685502 RepID=A0A8H6VEE3_9PEZI|nr:hypothetical protein HII31_09436 [Pseudocercospora fuligena]